MGPQPRPRVLERAASHPTLPIAPPLTLQAAAATDSLLITANRGLLRRLELAHVWLRAHPHAARWLAAADDNSDEGGEADGAIATINCRPALSTFAGES